MDTARELLIASAVLPVALLILYFGWRGKLDTWTLRLSDMSRLYWDFRRKHRGESIGAANEAYLRFVWRMNAVLAALYTIGLAEAAIRFFTSGD